MSIILGGRYRIGAGAPAFVIAEAGVNHNGRPELARRLVDAAADAGADAVKFQTFRAEAVVSAAAPKAEYQKETTGGGASQLEMLKALELSPEAHESLVKHCAERGILFLSTPFDDPSVEYLDALGVPAFKIPSGEITNFPFLRRIAAKRKPIILSTGMSDLEEVQAAVTILRDAGCRDLVVLHCVSSYPAEPASVNLRAMATMAEALDVPVGFSDHTTGIDIPVAAVALGACVIEKHFTLDRGLPGPDHQASLEPPELAAMVRSIRRVEASLGDGIKRPAASELGNQAVIRRSLHLATSVTAGTAVTAELLVALRPAGGIAPSELERVLDRRVVRDLAAGSRLEWEDLV